LLGSGFVRAGILGRCLHWQVSGFIALENAIYIAGCAEVLVN
jgi:hypothetical protein